MNKRSILDAAEMFDSWRIIPRLFMTACFIWVVWTTHTLLSWYVSLTSAERGLEASGFGAVVFTALIGFLKLVFDTYSRNGRDWNAAPLISSRTTVQHVEQSQAAPEGT